MERPEEEPAEQTEKKTAGKEKEERNHVILYPGISSPGL